MENKLEEDVNEKQCTDQKSKRTAKWRDGEATDESSLGRMEIRGLGRSSSVR